MYTHTHTHIYIYIHTYTHTHTHTHIYIYIHTHIHTYTHTHTHELREQIMTLLCEIYLYTARSFCILLSLYHKNVHLCLVLLCPFKAYWLRDAPTSLTFINCTLCLHCICVFCIYLRTNSDLCHSQIKLIGFHNRDEKCLQRGTDWVFKYSGLRFVCKGLIFMCFVFI